MSDFADDLLRVLDSLGLDRVIAVGHSMGGRILMEVCARNPDRMAAVVLSGAQASYLAHLDTAQRREYVSSRERLFERGEVPEDAARRVAQQVLPVGADPAVIARLVADFRRLKPEGYLAALSASAGWDQSAVLAGLKMPVAVMGGALDTVCPPSECARIAERIGQGPATILEGIGHMPQIEAPEKVTDFIRNFATDHTHLASHIATQSLKGETD